ncbi:MAG: hypothetical protein RR623_01695 [Bacilli bacterium]
MDNNTYEQPSVGFDDPNGNSNSRSIIAAAFVFLYGALVFDVVVFINWGGSVNLVYSQNAVI